MSGQPRSCHDDGTGRLQLSWLLRAVVGCVPAVAVISEAFSF